MTLYSIEPRTRKYVKGMDFYHLRENIKMQYKKYNYWIQD